MTAFLEIGKRPWMPRLMRLLLSYIFLCASIAGLVFFFLPPDASRFPEFGENDFLEYWIAADLLRQGQDPFNPTAVLEAQRALGWQEAKPLMMWNPPWVLTLLDPILRLPFDEAARTFLVFNASIICLCIFMLGSSSLQPALFFLTAIFSFPIFLLLLKGQITSLALLGLSLFLHAQRRRQYFWAGVALTLLSCKPHLLYLLSVPLGFWILRQKKFAVAGGLLAGLSALILLCGILSPPALGFWWHRGQFEGSPLLVPVSRWATSTLVTALRLSLRGLGQIETAWLIPAVPIATISLVVIFFKKHASRLKNREHELSWLIPLSLLTAPFAWIFDTVFFVVTDLAIVAALCAAKTHRTQFHFAALCVLKLLPFIVWIKIEPPLYSYWWYSLGYFALAAINYNLSSAMTPFTTQRPSVSDKTEK